MGLYYLRWVYNDLFFFSYYELVLLSGMTTNMKNIYLIILNEHVLLSGNISMMSMLFIPQFKMMTTAKFKGLDEYVTHLCHIHTPHYISIDLQIHMT